MASTNPLVNQNNNLSNQFNTNENQNAATQNAATITSSSAAAASSAAVNPASASSAAANPASVSSKETAITTVTPPKETATAATAAATVPKTNVLDKDTKSNSDVETTKRPSLKNVEYLVSSYPENMTELQKLQVYMWIMRLSFPGCTHPDNFEYFKSLSETERLELLSSPIDYIEQTINKKVFLGLPGIKLTQIPKSLYQFYCALHIYSNNIDVQPYDEQGDGDFFTGEGEEFPYTKPPMSPKTQARQTSSDSASAASKAPTMDSASHSNTNSAASANDSEKNKIDEEMSTKINIPISSLPAPPSLFDPKPSSEKMSPKELKEMDERNKKVAFFLGRGEHFSEKDINSYKLSRTNSFKTFDLWWKINDALVPAWRAENFNAEKFIDKYYPQLIAFFENLNISTQNSTHSIPQIPSQYVGMQNSNGRFLRHFTQKGNAEVYSLRLTVFKHIAALEQTEDKHYLLYPVKGFAPSRLNYETLPLHLNDGLWAGLLYDTDYCVLAYTGNLRNDDSIVTVPIDPKDYLANLLNNRSINTINPIPSIVRIAGRREGFLTKVDTANFKIHWKNFKANLQKTQINFSKASDSNTAVASDPKESLKTNSDNPTRIFTILSTRQNLKAQASNASAATAAATATATAAGETLSDWSYNMANPNVSDHNEAGNFGINICLEIFRLTDELERWPKLNVFDGTTSYEAVTPNAYEVSDSNTTATSNTSAPQVLGWANPTTNSNRNAAANAATSTSSNMSATSNSTQIKYLGFANVHSFASTSTANAASTAAPTTAAATTAASSNADNNADNAAGAPSKPVICYVTNSPSSKK